MQQYLQSFLSSIPKKNNHFGGKCAVVAFTSSVGGEGVSYATDSFGVELARRAGKRTLIADARQLSRLNLSHYSRISQHCGKTDVPNLWILTSDADAAESGDEENLQMQKYGFRSELELCVNNLQTLRFAFDYVLLDCPALSVSDEAALLCSETDGVIVVVEADRTKREQIQNTRQTIENANGNFLGFVLNKRQYTLPCWLYKRL